MTVPRSYFRMLALSMRAGLECVSQAFRSRHAGSVMSFLAPDGGFSGRRGGADLYYTGFATRALFALDRLDPPTAATVASYLNCQVPTNIIDAASLVAARIHCGNEPANAEKILSVVERFRTADGGYGKTPDAGSGSTYHSLLALLCYDAFGRQTAAPDRLIRFVESRRRTDGGFCEVASSEHSGTNATAAGLCVMVLLHAADPSLVEPAADHLCGLQHYSGGWPAARNVLLPDLLSTYTALATLELVGRLNRDVLDKALAFALTCEREGGGFGAGPWDRGVDAEYTCYGLGIVALARLNGLAIES